MVDFESLEFQVPPQNVGGYGAAEVSDVTVIPDGWTAIVEADLALAQGARVNLRINVDRNNLHDLPRLADEIVKGLYGHSLSVERFFFDGDPGQEGGEVVVSLGLPSWLKRLRPFRIGRPVAARARDRSPRYGRDRTLQPAQNACPAGIGR